MKKLFLILPAILLLWQCARQSQPQGGPKDEQDPQLLSSTPTNGQKNYKGKIIELIFDEFVKLKDPQDEIVITPSSGSKTKFTSKKNKVIISPEKPWMDSTTYSISFRGAIQDLNESNTAEDLHLAFSTGQHIDSLKIYGSVSEVFKEKIPEKITVALYQSDTFDIFTHKATYVTKTNKQGKFILQNLKPGKYYLYAFDDKNKNFKVDSKSEKFGFLKREVVLPLDKDSVQLNLIHVDTRRIKVTSVKNSSTISTIRFNKPLDKVNLKNDTASFVYSYGDNRSEIIVYKNFNNKDSLQISLSAYDSVLQQLDTAVYIKYTDSKKPEEKFKISDWQSNYDPETKTFETKSSINKLLKHINYDSIYIQIDTTSYQLIKPAEVKFDTLTKTISIKTVLNIAEKENMPHPVIIFGKGAFVSQDNDSTKSKDLKINILKTTETGTLLLEVKTTVNHFELLLQDNTGKTIKSIRDIKNYTLKYLTPGEYRIVVFVDANQNQKWDSGSFPKKLEPEKTMIYKNSENITKIPIRANWEVGPLVISF
jgi:uncharacterized protein (DUF2141 family)